MDNTTYQIILVNVLPIARYPQVFPSGLGRSEFSSKAKEFIKYWLVGSTGFVESQKTEGTTIWGDLYFYHHVIKEKGLKWDPQSPEGKLKWGGINFNILLVKEGFSPFVNEFPHQLYDHYIGLFTEAEQLAPVAYKAIWEGFRNQ